MVRAVPIVSEWEEVGDLPRLVPPVLPKGVLSECVQPVVDAGFGVRLRPWSIADAALLVEVYADAGIQRWHCKALADIDEAATMVQGWHREWMMDSSAHWAIITGDDTVVGRVALRKIDLIDGAAELGYWAVPCWRGNGFVPIAVAGVTRWAFGRGFQRLSLEHSVANPASCRVAEKAGYRCEGTLAAAARHLDGQHDMHLHAMTAADL